MDLILSGLLMGGFVLLMGWFVNRIDPACGDTPVSLPPAEETKALPERTDARLPAVKTGIVENGPGPYRELPDPDRIDRLLLMTDEQKWHWLMIEAKRDDRVDDSEARALARSMSFGFLHGKYRERVCRDVAEFAFRMRAMKNEIDLRVGRMPDHLKKLEMYDLTRDVDRQIGDGDISRIEALIREDPFRYDDYRLFGVIGGFTASRALCRLMECENHTARSFARDAMVKSGNGWALYWLEYVITYNPDDRIRAESIECMKTLPGGGKLLRNIQSNIG